MSCAIFQEQYSIWSWFLLNLCEMMIWPGAFFILLKFSFFMLLGGKRAENGPRWKIHWKKNKKKTVTLVTHHRNSIAFNHNFWNTYVKRWYLQAFFCLFGRLIFGFVRGVKGQKISQNEKQQLHPSHTISQEHYGLWSW